MAIKGINPYLMFNGTAEKAISLYESALGAKTERLMRFGEAQGMPVPEEAKNRILHATLELQAGNAAFMVSDCMPTKPVPTTSNVHIALDFDEAEDMKKKFALLAKGGTVTMELQDTFWGATYGQLTDEFGVNWMFNFDHKKK